jgi:aspartate/methionine/tyrosine aminotransferase
MNTLYSLTEKLKTLPDFIDLTDTNFVNNVFIFPNNILENELHNYLTNRKYTPEPKGLPVARNAISTYYRTYGLEANTDNILVTASTSESYNLLFNTFTKPGDEILLPSPTYPLFEYLAKFNHLKIKYYKLDPENNWEIDIESFENAITSKTKFAVLISPNNPTGSVLAQGELDEVLKICNEKKIDLIFDEVFNVFTDSKIQHLRPNLTNLNCHVYILNGISKMFALPDLKLAWIYGFGPELNEKIEELETNNDIFLNANYFVQSALPSLFENCCGVQEAIRARLAVNRKMLTDAFGNDSLFSYNPARGGIHAMIGIKCSKLSEDFTLELLKTSHILVHPAYFYDFQYDEKDTIGIVISYLLPTEKLKQGLECIKNLAC